MMEETQFTDDVKMPVEDHEEETFKTCAIHDETVTNLSDTYWGGDRIVHQPLPPPLPPPPDSLQTDSTTSSEDNLENKTLLLKQAKPLLYPKTNIRFKEPLPSRYGHCCTKRFCACVGITSLTGITTLLVVYLFRFFNNSKLTTTDEQRYQIIGCFNIEVDDVWVVGIPKLVTESAFRLVDVNHDGVLDPIFGFATGADGYNVPDVVCDIYFAGARPCLGGLLALDGRTGNELWRHNSPHEIFSVNCNEDLNGDGLQDCIIAGRVGIFEAVNSRNGSMLWNLTDPSVRVEAMNLYTGFFVSDLNDDAVPDIVNCHGGDPFGEPGSETRLPGKVLVISGKDGKVLRSMLVPDGRESYYSPVVYKGRDGMDVVLFGTGGETHSGALWAITLTHLYRGDVHKVIRIYSNSVKGVMTPPVLVDLTGDGVVDIVFATFNSTILAVDGASYSYLWNFTYPMSESYATPAPGYYNEDNVPDFIVHWQYGPGFPVYYHSVTTVIDGRTGQPLITPYIRSAVGAQTSPLTISIEGFGNDLFLYWNADCTGHEGEDGEFKFIEGTNVHEKSRSDFCRLRFQSDGLSRMYALSSKMKPPGTVVYDSVSRKSIEHKWVVNTSAEAQTFLEKHPEYTEDYKRWLAFIRHSNHDHIDVAKGSTSSSLNDRDDPDDIPVYSHNFEQDRNFLNRNIRNIKPHETPLVPGRVHFNRNRRHVGPHDEGGLQRLISTGTLAPSFLSDDLLDYNNTIDVIFATYWFYPAKTKALLPVDQKCIEKRMSHQEERFDKNSRYYGMDKDGYEHTVTDECLSLSNHQMSDDGTYQSQQSYTPYTVNMGQMTVYRLRLKCSCSNLTRNERCSQVRPFTEQQWSGYMGSMANSHWRAPTLATQQQQHKYTNT